MARHEQAKRAVGTALATVEGVQVHLEPLITGTQWLFWGYSLAFSDTGSA
jgi:ammonia channel protein AmtB